MHRWRSLVGRCAFVALLAGCDAPEDPDLVEEQIVVESSTPSPHLAVAQEYTQSMQRVLDEHPVRLEIAQGEIQWESEVQPGVAGGAWLVADVIADVSCGAPKQTRVRVQYNSELPPLQPTSTTSLLLVGRLAESGVVEVASIVNWGHDGKVAIPHERTNYTLDRAAVMRGC
jgi:hypothetical protein